jgi:hypothetical protein
MSQPGVTPQTSKMLWGSVKFEVGENIGAMSSLGTLQNAAVKESWKEIRFKTGNGGHIEPQIADQEMEFTADLNEHDLELLNLLRGNIDTYAAVAGTIVNNATQTVASGGWAYNKFIKIENQNADGSAITVDSVTAGTDGVLVANTDYYVGRNNNGEYGIFVIDSATVTTTAQTLAIQYDYTPAASQTLSSGGKFQISYRVIRITNTHPISGYTYIMVIYKGANAGPLEISFQDDGAETPNTYKVTIRGVCDTSRTAGDQLYKITRQVA